MAHDSAYFRRQAAEVRSSAFHKDGGESVEVAGHLALAYAALARHRMPAADPDEGIAADLDAADSAPLMLRD